MNLGSVRDQRGTPLALVPVNGLSTYETNLTTDGSGKWLAHETTFNWPYTVTVTVDGSTVAHASTEFTQLPSGDMQIDFVIPSPDNVIANPGFETAGAAWTPAAATSFTGSPASETQSGSAGLRLGWGPGGAAVLDVASTATAVVSGTTAIAHRPSQRDRQPAFVLLTGACVSELLGETDTRDLAVRSDGTVAVIVDNGDGTRSFRQRSPAGVWSSAEPFPFMGTGLGHRLLADSTGRWHAVWAEGDGMVHVAHREDDGKLARRFPGRPDAEGLRCRHRRQRRHPQSAARPRA